MAHAIVVMGVAGSGKSTLAQALAAALARPFVEGDAFHAPDARASMAAGKALTDDDRAPWLDRLALRLAQGDGAVLACSALKRAYRDRLRAAGPLRLMYCAIDHETAARRLALRTGHFFPAALLASQFAALEPPAPEEGALVLAAAISPAAQTEAALAWLAVSQTSQDAT